MAVLRRAVLGITVACAAALPGVPASAAASAPPPTVPAPARAAATAGGWSRVPAQRVSGENTILNAAAVPAPGDVWVAGYQQADLGGVIEDRTLAEHFNGKGFVIVPTPDRETAPAVDFLQALSGTSASDVWAVGYSSPPGVQDETLVEHWNGTAWSIVASPDPGNVGDILEGVAAISPADAWAVGGHADRANFYEKPMALHWDGTAWTAVAVPNAAGCTGHSYLTAVSAVSAANVWATGWCGAGGSTPDQGYVEHWNGARWKVAAGAGTVPADSQLYGVSTAGPRDVWVAGLFHPQGAIRQLGLSLHWDGTTWTQAAQQGHALEAVLATRGHTTWGVGSGPSPQTPFSGPLSTRFTHGAWHNVKVPAPFGFLDGLALEPGGQLWAAGAQLTRQGSDIPLILTRPVESGGGG